MKPAQEGHCQNKFTREALSALSKERLIEIILLLQEQNGTLSARVDALEAELDELKRRLGQNSRNSSKPPSSDGLEAEPRRSKRRGERKPGGQPGHEGHNRDVLPVEKVSKVVPVKPCKCKHCGRPLNGEDRQPKRHQVWEIPAIDPEVVEYQLHQLYCPECDAFTRASLPDGVPEGAFGPRVTAIVAILSGVYRLSKRQIESILADVFHIPISLGSICECEAEVSGALAQPVHEACEAAQEAEALHADETGWRENNHKAWLWVAVTSVATVFLICAERTKGAARELLGEFVGVLISDRWGAYNFYKGARQWCWAHLLRDFTAFSELKGKAGEIGAALVAKTEEMFHQWRRLRDGTLQRGAFREYMQRLRAEIESLLREGMSCGDAKMERSCKRILGGAQYLWTFVDTEGVEPTNNAAERALRPAVQWRKGSFGSHSAEGSRFVERVITAAATCKQHGRSVIEYITQVCEARLHGRPAPSLLPTAAQVQGKAA